MLKTNSKKAKENIRAYIMDSWNIEEGEEARTWEETKEDIMNSFIFQAYRSEYERRQNRQEAFINWLCGLPRCLGDYVLNKGISTLAEILEETPEEAGKYTEDEAENKLGYLIYREVINNA